MKYPLCLYVYSPGRQECELLAILKIPTKIKRQNNYDEHVKSHHESLDNCKEICSGLVMKQNKKHFLKTVKTFAGITVKRSSSAARRALNLHTSAVNNMIEKDL